MSSWIRLAAAAAGCLMVCCWGCAAPPGEPSPAGDPFRAVRGSYLGQSPPGRIPEIFAPGLISTASREGGVVVYPGGSEIYFWVVGGQGGAVTSTIYVTKQRDGDWTNPEVVPFSGTYVDGYIALHPDGSRLFFQSDRPIDGAESAFTWNIWFVEREGDGWGEPRSIGRPINGRSHTGGASATLDGTLYFTIMELGGTQEIYRSEWVDGAYQEPRRLPDAVNGHRQQYDSYVAPDESYLVFGAIEGPGHQAGDLYVSFRSRDGTWSDARRMGPAVNAEGDKGAATITPDGKFLFFARQDPEGRGDLDIYWVDAEIVNEWQDGS